MTLQMASDDVGEEPRVSHSSAVSGDPYHPYRRTLLTVEQIRMLSTLRPSRVVVDTVWCWLWIAASWAAVAVYPHWWTVALAIPVVGTRYYALFIIGHDGLHRRLFPGRDRNDLFNDVCILGALGAVTRINNKNHLLHHKHLATHEDPDRHRHACFNKADIVEVFAFLTGVSSAVTSARNVFFPRQPHGRASVDSNAQDLPADKYTPRDIVIVFAWQALLIGGLTWAIGWWAYPILWLLPVFVFTYLGDNLRSFVEHSHPESDAKADTHRLVTFRSNRLERLFVAPMNMNFHAAHHLWVGIPYYNLPLADRLMREHPASVTLEWRQSYAGYLWKYLRAMPLTECKGQ